MKINVRLEKKEDFEEVLAEDLRTFEIIFKLLQNVYQEYEFDFDINKLEPQERHKLTLKLFAEWWNLGNTIEAAQQLANSRMILLENEEHD